jgi:glycosyltransferase involved in cell wall biosynthesis
MTKNAIVCVSNDLSTDQRVHKTCLTLQKCEYDVVEMGRILHNSITLERPYRTLRKKLIFNSGPLFYAELNIRFFCHLLFAKVDLIFSNDLDTLLACYLASKIRGKRLIYDSHELFTELPELHKSQVKKQIWESIEKRILPSIKHSITVCHSISEYYKAKYKISMAVVRNIPNLRTTDIENLDLEIPNKKIIIYQGALNKGRCLENVLHAMTMVTDGYLIIIGDGDLAEELKELTIELNVTDRVRFLGKIDGTSLHQYTRFASLGLCLLENEGLNYYYSLPNRIFDYLYSGVPVLASNFPEISNIVQKYNTGILIENNNPTFIAQQINQLLQNSFDTSHFPSVIAELNWEKEENVLIDVIKKSEQK